MPTTRMQTTALKSFSRKTSHVFLEKLCTAVVCILLEDSDGCGDNHVCSWAALTRNQSTLALCTQAQTLECCECGPRQWSTQWSVLALCFHSWPATWLVYAALLCHYVSINGLKTPVTESTRKHVLPAIVSTMMTLSLQLSQHGLISTGSLAQGSCTRCANALCADALSKPPRVHSSMM